MCEAMSIKISCVHLYTLDLNLNDAILLKKRQDGRCGECTSHVPNKAIWLCLHSGCLMVLCGGEGSNGHAGEHNAALPGHCLVMCLDNFRVWCYLCDMEVTDSIHQQLQLQIGKENVHIDSEDCEEGLASNVGKFEPITVDEVKEEYDVEDSEDDSVSIISSQLKPRGVVGLRNLGLTCYMNAALQVLGFSPGIASFFLNCPGSLIGIKKERPLALTYRDLIREAWHSESPSSIVPSQLYHCFKQLYPMFRAFSQQDSQEFLRYFLDEIHSELRQMVPAVYNEQDSDESEDECDSDCELRSAAGESCCSLGDAPSESRLSRDPSDGHDSEENRYETCDSGVSESETDGSPSMLFGGRKRRRRPAPQSDVDFRAAAPAKSVKSSNSSHLSRHQAKSLPHSAVSSPHHSTSPSPQAPPSPGGRTLSSLKTSGIGSYAPSLASAESCSGSTMSSGRRQYNKNSSKKHRSKKSQQQQYSSSIVSDLFDGQLISSVQCLTCNSISARRETFQDLSLPIPSGELSIPADKEHGSDGWVWWMFQWLMSWVWGPAVSLSHCLSAFFSADELKGDNMYSCEKCGKLRNGLKFAKVVKLPEVLVVHLKRFRHDYMFSSKISQHVAFPLSDLNLQPYLHRDCVSEVCQYSLFGVICHHGSVVGGHYTSLAQHPKTGSWFEFDDETVSFVSPEYVQRSQAYVLFYKKSNPEAEKLRGRAYALMRSHALNQSLVKFYISRQWFNKFQSFGECGPIDNRDFLCPHGGVQPRKVNIVSLLVKTVNESLWEFLKGQFGGDPPCTRLYTCPLCTSQHKELVARQRIELNTFKVLNSQSDQVFGVSMTWFSQWEKFVLDKSHNPPPAIDNTSVIKQYQQRHHSPLLFRSNSDYVSITEECWNFFQHVYGGGPAFCLRPLEPVNQFNQQHHLSQDHGQFQSSFVHPQAEPARVHSRQAKRTLLVEEVHTSSRSGTSDDENLLARARVSIENLPNTQSNNPYTAAKDCAVSNDDQNSTPLVCQEGSDATDSTACDDPPSFSSRLPLVEQQSDCEYNTEDEPEETGTFVIQQIQNEELIDGKLVTENEVSEPLCDEVVLPAVGNLQPIASASTSPLLLDTSLAKVDACQLPQVDALHFSEVCTTPLPRVKATRSLPEIDAAPSFPEVDDPRSFPEVDANLSFPEVDANQPLLEIDAAPSFPKVYVTRAFPKVNSTTSFSEVDASPSFPELDASPSFPEVDASPSFPEVDATSSIPEVDATPSLVGASATNSTASLGKASQTSLVESEVVSSFFTKKVRGNTVKETNLQECVASESSFENKPNLRSNKRKHRPSDHTKPRTGRKTSSESLPNVHK